MCVVLLCWCVCGFVVLLVGYVLFCVLLYFDVFGMCSGMIGWCVVRFGFEVLLLIMLLCGLLWVLGFAF